jgi:Predicted dehydrogenases and related proteins
MINLGIIGTNWITHQFVKAALDTGSYTLHSVYSRRLETAQQFAGEYEGTILCETDLDHFVNNTELSTVYIASPNSLHFSQAKAAILAGKHVIVEKPAFSNPTEMDEILALAKEQKVLFFEAARNIHEKSFQKVADLLAEEKEIIGANFSYMKYSSRYDAVLNGEEPNIFSPKFSGGSLSDLGIYSVYAALAWFGKPESVHHFARKIATGVDGIGTVILRYANFDVTIQHGKIGESFLSSEIYFAQGTLWMNAVNAIEKAELHDRHTGVRALDITVEENPMIEEARDFAAVIEAPETPENQKRYETWCTLAQNVNHVLYEMRQQADIHFAADEK